MQFANQDVDRVRYYQPSGRFGPVALIFVLIGNVGGAYGFSLLYAVILWWLPFVYINPVLTLGLAMAISVIGVIAIQLGKLRNPMLARLIGFISGAMSVYLSWATLVALMIANESIEGTGKIAAVYHISATETSVQLINQIALEPELLWDMLRVCYHLGHWSAFTIVMNGWVLAIVWLVEALILVGLPVYIGGGVAGEPFSEESNDWLEQKEFSKHLGWHGNPAKLREELEAGFYQTLLDAEPTTERLTNLKVILFKGQEQEDHFLSLQYNKIKNPGGKNSSEDSRDLVQYLAIPEYVARALEDKLADAVAET